MSIPARLAIFASGSGTNAQSIINHFQYHPTIKTSLMLSNKSDAKALEKAVALGVDTFVFTKSQFRESDEVLNELKRRQITHLILAGFLLQIPANFIQAFPNRIINIHPSLLPKFGGKGMYGIKVHEAVKTAGENETGITIHEVNEQYDEGKILFQESCKVDLTEMAVDIAKKVQELEHQHFPRIIEEWLKK